MSEALPTPLAMSLPAPSRGEQPPWNRQRSSAMPAHRYARAQPRMPHHIADRAWPSQAFQRAPLWASVDLRDGNQALANPMDPYRKGLMFDVLVRLGFKHIEVGYPSSSEADFEFVRSLIIGDRVPDDVTISVFTPAKLELIDRTFESIAGAERAMVHLCNATACLWREVVYGMTRDEVEQMAVSAAEHIARRAEAMRGTDLLFEYSPETFNVTEPDYALQVSNRVAAIWDPSPDRPVTLNLPTTVETDSPNVFADQIEWMHRNLDNRSSIILSVHPHNDRGTAVASAELAVLAGADRVEGTLFGNGERTGNVCLATLEQNLFSQGIDPQLDFSDIDGVRRTVEECNQIPVHTRHPYVGDLVYTAFSGTHQDAIAKGFAAFDRRAAQRAGDAADLAWDVPYLPIDPKDVGRTYESVVRVNSQSGKGGIAHVLKNAYGMELPLSLRAELARRVQRVADDDGTELAPAHLWEIIQAEYLRADGPVVLVKEIDLAVGDEMTTVDALVVTADGGEVRIGGQATDPAAAFVDALTQIGLPVGLVGCSEHSLGGDQGGEQGARTAAYAEVVFDGRTCNGIGIDADPATALLHAVASAVNRGGRNSS